MSNGTYSNTALVLVYGAVLTLGVLLIVGAIISLLSSFTPGKQDRPRGAAHPLFSRATTYSLGLGAVVFGTAGLLGVLVFHLDPVTSILTALGAGLLVGLAALGLLVYLPSRGRDEETLIDFDAAGRRARVVIPIPGNGIGEVTFRDGEKAINLAARSTSGQPIDEGTAVVIERVTHRVAVVSPQGGDSHVFISQPS